MVNNTAVGNVKEFRMKGELLKLFKEYQKYISYWNKQEEKKDRPIPIGGVYQVSFTGFIKWLENQ